MEIKNHTKFSQLDQKSWRIKTIKKLQSKRNSILRGYWNASILFLLLFTIGGIIAGKL
jgi:hypothetical protein